MLSTAPDQRLKRVDLARRLLLTPSGITRLLEGLERAGLVERATCPTDLRVTYAQLTDAGRSTLEAASCGHVASIKTLFEEHLSCEEIEQLAASLGEAPGRRPRRRRLRRSGPSRSRGSGPARSASAPGP